MYFWEGQTQAIPGSSQVSVGDDWWREDRFVVAERISVALKSIGKELLDVAERSRFLEEIASRALVDAAPLSTFRSAHDFVICFFLFGVKAAQLP